VRDEDRYLVWLEEHAMGQDRSYDELLDYLYTKPFFYLIPMDDNRVKDGLDLRDKFESGFGDRLAEKSCSMLELMLALAYRCEGIMVDMHDPDFHRNPSRWVRIMLKSLGLVDMVNGYFDYDVAECVIDDFIEHRYSYYGEGSLFVVKNPKYDMRKADLWYQASWYMSEQLYN